MILAADLLSKMIMNKYFIFLPMLGLATGCLQMEHAKLVQSSGQAPQLERIIMPSSCLENLDKAAQKKDESIIKVRLKNDVVDKILEEIKGKSNIMTFWSLLSQQTSKDLILNLGLSLGPELSQSTRLPLQAVAYVFDEMQRTGAKDMAYQIRTKEGLTYSFEVNGEAIETISRLAQRCSDKSLDVSQVLLPKITQKIEEIKETFRCRLKNTNVDIIRFEKTSFIMTKSETIEVDNKLVKESENNRKITLRVDSPEVQLTLKFKKKRDRELDDVDGKKTKIDLRTASTDINGTGVCEFMAESESTDPQ